MNPPPIPAAPGNPPAMPMPAKTSALAITSLVFGILGCTIIGSVVGLTCGIIALIRIKKSAGRLKGESLALAGIIVSGVMLLLLPVMAGMLLPALGKAKFKAQTISSVNNLKNIGLAARIYSTDHDNKFPPAANWVETLRPNLGADADKLLHRPAGSQSECGYGYNLQIAGMSEDLVNPQTVLFFELQNPRCDAVGGVELLRQPKNNSDLIVVGFADGSVMQLRAERLATLRWKP